MAQATNCPRCDHPLDPADKFCKNCKKPVSAGSALASQPQKPVNCPICKIPLYPAQLDAQELLHCAECQGMGMKREGIMKLQPQGKKEIQLGIEERNHKTPPYFEPRKKPPFLICPFCSKRMEAVKLGKTDLDLCTGCSALWLEGPKVPQLQDLISPYKWRFSKSKESPLNRMRRMGEDD